MRAAYRPRLSLGKRQAMDMEIKRQCAEYDKRNATEIDAMVLWILHEEFGFGPERYEINNEAWLCTRKLKGYGVGKEILKEK